MAPMPDDLVAVLRVHRQLKECMRRIDGSSWHPSLLRDTVERLASVLPEHFAYEERAGGLFERLRASEGHPDFEVDALEEEHRRLLDQVRELESTPMSAVELRHELKLLVRRLRAHERRESVLASGLGPFEDGEGPAVDDGSEGLRRVVS